MSAAQILELAPSGLERGPRGRIDPEKLRHLRAVGQEKDAKRKWTPSGQIVFETENLLRLRYGGALETDDAFVIAEAVLPHLIAHERAQIAAGFKRAETLEIALGWLRRWFPAITKEEAESTVQAASRAAPMSSKRLSELLRYTRHERSQFDERGIVIRQLAPCDETEESRKERRREKERLRSKRYRSKGNKNRHAAYSNIYSVTGNVTFHEGGAPAAVWAAVLNGATSIPEIEAKTERGNATVKMALSRLVKSGHLIRTGRGKYSIASNYNAGNENAIQDGTAGEKRNVA